MPRGSKAKYTSKQKRQARHIEEGYERKGVSRKAAESRAWATVNKIYGGGERRGGGGYGKPKRKLSRGRKQGRTRAGAPRRKR